MSLIRIQSEDGVHRSNASAFSAHKLNSGALEIEEVLATLPSKKATVLVELCHVTLHDSTTLRWTWPMTTWRVLQAHG